MEKVNKIIYSIQKNSIPEKDDNPKEENISFQEKVEKNIWDKIEDFIHILREMKKDNWVWWRNSEHKYVNLRVDMRDGRCIFLDDKNNRISIDDIKYQYNGE